MILRSLFLAGMIGRLFYDSWIAALLLLPVSMLYYLHEKEEKKKAQLRELGIQFRDVITAMAANQKAGYAMENAVMEASKDIALLYGKDSRIYQELLGIIKGLRNNVKLEDLFLRMADRCRQEDITEFCEVFSVAKRNGGNMTKIMEDTVSLIGAKLDTEKEIAVMIAEKKLEARLMEVIPFFIILYIGLANQGFFDPLYHNLSGNFIMSAALGVYLLSYMMIEKIIAIEV